VVLTSEVLIQVSEGNPSGTSANAGNHHEEER
jgi:hypothetical protein